MATEQGLYAKVVMLSRKVLNITEANKGKNVDKFKLQGHSARLQCWFDLDFDWTEGTFSTNEPNFSMNFFQRHDKTQDKHTFKIFEVLIGNKNVWRK